MRQVFTFDFIYLAYSLYIPLTALLAVSPSYNPSPSPPPSLRRWGPPC